MNTSAPFCTRFTDITCDRKRQIDTVKVFNDNVSEISQNEEYSVKFKAGENTLAMLIILGPNFPMEKPLLKITPQISHQWLNENSEIVSAPGYLNFSVYSDLGRVVQAIIREFQRNPPSLKQEEYLLSKTNTPSLKNYENSQTPSLPEEFEQSFEVMSSVIGRLHKMSLDELKSLDEDNNSLEQFVNELSHMKSLKQAVRDIMNATKELEKKNIELEMKTENYSSKIEEKQREFENYKDTCTLLCKKYSKLVEIRSPVNVKKRLRKTAATLDGESESVAENFLNTNITLDEFFSQYITLRMKVHEIKLREKQIDLQGFRMDNDEISRR